MSILCKCIISIVCVGKFVPEDAVNEMKSNFTLPSDGDEYVDEIRWVELERKDCLPLVEM